MHSIDKLKTAESSPVRTHSLLWLEQEKQETLFLKYGFTEVRIGSGRTIYYLIRLCLILANS